MTHQIMVQCGDFLISGIVAAQAGTGFVASQLFRAGGRLLLRAASIMLCGAVLAGGIVAVLQVR